MRDPQRLRVWLRGIWLAGLHAIPLIMAASATSALFDARDTRFQDNGSPTSEFKFSTSLGPSSDGISHAWTAVNELALDGQFIDSVTPQQFAVLQRSFRRDFRTEFQRRRLHFAADGSLPVGRTWYPDTAVKY